MSLPRHAPASCQAQLGRGGMATCRRTSDMNRSPQFPCVPRPSERRGRRTRGLTCCGIYPVYPANAPCRPRVPAHADTYAALRAPGSSGANQGAGRERAVARQPSRRSQPVQPNRRSIVPSPMTVPQPGERINAGPTASAGLLVADKRSSTGQSRGSRVTMGNMSASDAAPLPRLGEVYFDVRGESRSMRLSWYADTGVAVFSIWQGGTGTGYADPGLPATGAHREADSGEYGRTGAHGRYEPEATAAYSGDSVPGGQGGYRGERADSYADEPTGVYRGDLPGEDYREDPGAGYRDGGQRPDRRGSGHQGDPLSGGHQDDPLSGGYREDPL